MTDKLTPMDQERLTKAVHAAGFLAADLQAMTTADNGLLAEHAVDLLAQAVQLKTRLERLAAVTSA